MVLVMGMSGSMVMRGEGDAHHRTSHLRLFRIHAVVLEDLAMSKVTPADAAYIITKAQYIALYTRRATELNCSGHQERADKEMALLETFVSGIAVAREAE